MAGLKQFLSDHFEKLALFVALIIALVALSSIFLGGTVAEKQDEINRLITAVELNIGNARVDPEYDPEKMESYDVNVMAAFQPKEGSVASLEIEWYSPGIQMLTAIVLELPFGQPFEETYPIEQGPVDSVSIDDPEMGSVKLTDDKKSFILTRALELDKAGVTAIHLVKDKEHYVHRLSVDIRIVYVPQAPVDVKGYDKPGRNFIIWATNPDDLDRVVGFNVYRKDSRDGQYDLDNPINRDLIEPLNYVPEEGEDELGAIDIVDEEDVEEEEAAAKEEEEGGGEDGEEEEEKEEEKKKEDISFAERIKREREGGAGGWPADTPDMPDGSGRGLDAGGNKGGMFIDRDVTPLKTYWYVVQTVALKSREEIAKEMADGVEEPEPNVTSIVSEEVSIKAADVTKMYFRSLVGSIEGEAKMMAMAVMEVKRFEKVAWISGSFNVKIDQRIGGRKPVDLPKVDPDTGDVEWVREWVDFKTPYILKDIIEVKTIKVHEMKKPVINKDTERQEVDENGEPVFKIEKIEMPFSTYKVIVKHDEAEEGKTEEYPMTKPRAKEEPSRAVRRTGVGQKRGTPSRKGQELMERERMMKEMMRK